MRDGALRRTLRVPRAAVLEALAALEVARWQVGEAGSSVQLISAVRKLETAALIARIPRSAVRPYLHLSVACLWTLDDELEIRGDPEWTGLAVPTANAVTSAAEIVGRSAWSNPVSRQLWLWLWLWLWLRLRRLRKQVDALDNKTFKSKFNDSRDVFP